MNQLECVKCGGRMTGGLVIDYTHGGKVQSRWVEGAPEESFWTGLKTSGRAQYKAETYRCERCGYLESYALEKTEESMFG